MICLNNCYATLFKKFGYEMNAALEKKPRRNKRGTQNIDNAALNRIKDRILHGGAKI